MFTEKEALPHKESRFDKLLKSREADGWHFMGREGCTQTKFSKDAKFEEVPYQTEISIKEKYLQTAKQQDPLSEFEVDLVLDEGTDKLRRFRAVTTEEEYQNAIKQLNEANKNYFVFVRKIEK